MSVATRPTGPRTAFDWKRWPETEAAVDRWVAPRWRATPSPRRWPSGCATRRARGSTTGSTTSSCPTGRASADACGRSATPARPILTRSVRRFTPTTAGCSRGSPSWPGGGPEVREVAIKVESVAAFSRAHDLGLDVQGYPLGPYRVGRVAGRADGAWRWSSGGATSGSSRSRASWPGRAGCSRTPRATPWPRASSGKARRRRFDDDAEGFDATEATLDRGHRAGRVAPTWRATSSSRSSATTGSRATARRRCRRRGRTGSGSAGRTTTTTPSAVRGGSSRA